MGYAKRPIVLDLPTRKTRRQRNTRIVAILGVGLLCALLFGLVPRKRVNNAAAPTINATAPTINVGPAIIAEPAAETGMPIQVWPADELLRERAWVRLTGLPWWLSLSSGELVAAGNWRVPLADLPNLKIRAPRRDGVSRSEVSIALMSADNVLLAEARSAFVVMSSADVGRSRKTSELAPAPDILPTMIYVPVERQPTSAKCLTGEETASTVPGREDRQRALKLVQSGDAKMSIGDVASARYFYRNAADLNLPEAAVSLAATYDPSELSSWHTAGIAAEPEQAKAWYEKALRLTHAQVNFYLKRLGPTVARKTAPQ